MQGKATKICISLALISCTSAFDSSFLSSFSGVSEFANNEQTRSFLALEVGGGHLQVRGICGIGIERS